MVKRTEQKTKKLSALASPDFPDAERGRGAVSNQASERFDSLQREEDGDWSDMKTLLDGRQVARKTEIYTEKAKHIISRNQSPDLPFDRSINMYRGCEHGCIYCFARPTHAYNGHSPGLDFERILYVKDTAPTLLLREMRNKNYKPRPIAMGTNTDPYQPIERQKRLTRQILEIMESTHHPCMITTKSDMIIEDIDLLTALAAKNLVRVAITITTLDKKLARTMEPRAPTAPKRLYAIKKLSERNIPTSVFISPIIPAINDHEMENIAHAAYEAGARHLSYILLRLPHEVAPLFRQWLTHHYPQRAQKVMKHMRDMRGGRVNDPRFGDRMHGEGPFAELIRQRAKIIRHKMGYTSGFAPLSCTHFRQPLDDGEQMAFF